MMRGMKLIHRYSLAAALALLGSCGFGPAASCPAWSSWSPCWRYWSPAELRSHDYRHIVAITFPALSSQSTWERSVGTSAPLGSTYQEERREVRASLAEGFRAAGHDSVVAQRITYDSAFLSDLESGRSLPVVDTSKWRTRWPKADAILEVRQVLWGKLDCASGNSLCPALEVFLFDVTTDSAVWRVDVDPYVSRPPGQRILGPWMAQFIVDQLKKDEIIR